MSLTITPSHIIEYIYCPRFTFFEYVLCVPQYEEKNYKVMRGRHLHDEKLERNKDYLRKRLGVVEKHISQYLTNDMLRGEVDEVLVLSDGTLAPLDYKFAVYEERVYHTYHTQLICYAWLIEDNFDRPVRRGFLVYTRSQHKVITVDISEADKALVKRYAREILEIIGYNRYPKATKDKKKCLNCTYRNICTQ